MSVPVTRLVHRAKASCRSHMVETTHTFLLPSFTYHLKVPPTLPAAHATLLQLTMNGFPRLGVDALPSDNHPRAYGLRNDSRTVETKPFQISPVEGPSGYVIETSEREHCSTLSFAGPWLYGILASVFLVGIIYAQGEFLSSGSG